MKKYIYEAENWPNFEWKDAAVLQALSAVRHRQGHLMGQLSQVGFEDLENTNLETMTEDVLKSTEIEGEYFDRQQVRSSIARHLGLEIAGLVPSQRQVDGVVQMLLDAVQNHAEPLSKERLFAWHTALFPTGRSGMYAINIGVWRLDEKGPMQVVSGRLGFEKVHFQAPAAALLENEMQQFLAWFNAEQGLDPVLKAALAHFWFITIHPFDDGNGRIARAIADMQLARAEAIQQRFYSMAAAIQKNRTSYYTILEKCQSGNLDISAWVLWFLEQMDTALETAQITLDKVLKKAKFWQNNATIAFNERQIKMLNLLFDDFFGNLTSSKWAKLCKCSTDTALRDIQDLVAKGLLVKSEAGGRSVRYEVVFLA